MPSRVLCVWTSPSAATCTTWRGPTGHGDQLLDGPSEVALVQPDGSHSTVLNPADGPQNPTSIALRGDTVYVLSAGWITAKDPNLILAHLNE
ncbi:hypothetical protein OHB54_04960 [Streptomyces sp. NBC_01007]|nr:hypothetical protein OHB54_04960 [Streptomyces sp. NBC_01007]